MIKLIKASQIIFLLLFFFFSGSLYSQNNETTIIYLKNGYSVKGEVIEKTEKSIKIKTIGGDILEYSFDEISKSEDVVDRTTSFSFKGAKVVNFGFGIGNILQNDPDFKTSFPTISTSFEYGIADLDVGAIGIGAILALGVSKKEYSYYRDNSYRYTNFIIGARSSYHYSFLEKLDTYGGLILGYNFEKIKDISAEESYYMPVNDNKFLWSVYVGGRYYFTENLAAMAEIGYGISYFNFGVAYKF